MRKLLIGVLGLLMVTVCGWATTYTIDANASGTLDTTMVLDPDLVVYMGGVPGSDIRGWMKFDVSSISLGPGEEVLSVDVSYYVFAQSYPYYEIYSLENDPVGASAPNLYGDCRDGTLYFGWYSSAQGTGYRTHDLGDDAADDVEAALGTTNWFAIGFVETDWTPTYYDSCYGAGGSRCETDQPYITVETGTPTPPPPGQDCSNPVVVNLPADLPYTDAGQTTCGMIDDYDATCLGSYDGGEDIIYELNVTSAVDVNISISTVTTYVGICIDALCPPGDPCMAYSTNSSSGAQTLSNIHLDPGTYYIMVDTWPSPDCIPSFDLNITEFIPPPDYYWGDCAGNGTGTSYPAFNWLNVTDNVIYGGSTSTPGDGIMGDDDWEGPYSIGFTFPFYGYDYTQFCICSNGYLMLGSTGSTDLSNDCIPNTNSPNTLLAWYWDDLDPGDDMDPIYWGNTTAYGQNALVVTFEEYHEYPGSSDSTHTVTAQVMLLENGNVKYQYLQVGSNFDVNGGTIGIENESGAVGIEYLCNGCGYPLADGVCVEFGMDPGALPVELTAFDAFAMSEAVRLEWATASESGNDHFNLYRSTSADGEFTQVATIAGVGESATQTNYSFVDRNLANGVTYYYRLADVDINGNLAMHDAIVSATPDDGAMGVMVTEYKLHQNYPNPFNPTTTIMYDVKEAGHVTLAVYNLLGQEVATLVDEVKESNRYQLTFDASGLAAGVYFYRVNVNDFSDVSKMVILK